jgi:hypothetical protein
MKGTTLVLALAIALAACASDGTKTAGRTAERIDELGAGIQAGSTLIEDVVVSLDAMVENPEGDLQAMFNTYRSELSRLEDMAKKIGQRTTAVWDRRDEYFEQWEKSLEEIQNEELKNLAASRRKQTEEAFKRVQQSLDKAQSAFDPLLANLRDIRTVLTNDLNPTGVKAIAPVAGKVRSDAAKTQAALAEVRQEFERLARTITPKEQEQ